MKKIMLLLFIPFHLFAGHWIKTHDCHNEIALSIHCPDSNNCFILVQESGYTILYKSVSQGKSWDTLYISDFWNEGTPYLINARDGAIAGLGHYYIAMQEKGYLKISDDSGKTFRRMSFNYEKRIREVEMLDSNYGIAIADTAYFLTNDGWENFEKYDIAAQNPEFDGNLSMPVMHGNKDISCLLHVSDYAAYVRYYHESKVWKIIYKFPHNEAGYFSPDGLFFVNEKLAFTSGRYRADTSIGNSTLDCIYRTKDGGETWEELIHQEHEPYSGLQEIAFKDELNGIAVGQFGKIIRTTDGGDSWVYDEVPQEMEDDIPATMIIGWAGEVPIIGTFNAGFWYYYEETGIKEITKDGDIKVRQESGKLLISIEDNTFSKYTLFISDINGRIVKKQELNSGIGTVYKPVDINDLANGSYLFCITNGKKTKTGTVSVVR